MPFNLKRGKFQEEGLAVLGFYVPATWLLPPVAIPSDDDQLIQGLIPASWSSS